MSKNRMQGGSHGGVGSNNRNTLSCPTTTTTSSCSGPTAEDYYNTTVDPAARGSGQSLNTRLENTASHHHPSYRSAWNFDRLFLLNPHSAGNQPSARPPLTAAQSRIAMLHRHLNHRPS
ncbi:hypothetical protein PGT21_027243 [Puccinia graminis f. sp. tritici]|uniref:Uncharacterized protein n=1 Tax=Puccinia graminis f. sp. tritici TaxID=56615 RepID=A0A5B0MFS6_PUCGR|nr:hypothetical protein PGTUg99_014827 [Puccinia graminis f. sp. tritici]KAA1091155.1 hypothetical protein PGT21_027243 [Puccinia graminis f. sp. tritici]